MKRVFVISLCLVLLAGVVRADAPPTVTVASQEPAKPIYHSSQTPGYTAWCNLWRTPKGELRLAFQQVTGPVEDWTKRKNVTVILGSSDEGATCKMHAPWKQVARMRKVRKWFKERKRPARGG